MISCSPVNFTADPVLPCADTILLFFPLQINHVLPTTDTVFLFFYSPVFPTADTVHLISLLKILFSCSPYCRFCFPVLLFSLQIPFSYSVFMFSLPQILFSTLQILFSCSPILLFSLLQILFSCSPYCRYCSHVLLFSCSPVHPTVDPVLLFSFSPVHPTADTVLMFSYSPVLLFTLVQILFFYSPVLLFSCSPYCRSCLSLIEKKHSLFTALIKFLFYPWFCLKTINVETRNGNCSELATILFFIIFIFTTPHNLTVGRMDIQTFTIYLLE